jgi:hypothetical protein
VYAVCWYNRPAGAQPCAILLPLSYVFKPCIVILNFYSLIFSNANAGSSFIICFPVLFISSFLVSGTSHDTQKSLLGGRIPMNIYFGGSTTVYGNNYGNNFFGGHLANSTGGLEVQDEASIQDIKCVKVWARIKFLIFFMFCPRRLL